MHRPYPSLPPPQGASPSESWLYTQTWIDVLPSAVISAALQPSSTVSAKYLPSSLLPGHHQGRLCPRCQRAVLDRAAPERAEVCTVGPLYVPLDQAPRVDHTFLRTVDRLGHPAHHPIDHFRATSQHYILNLSFTGKQSKMTTTLATRLFRTSSTCQHQMARWQCRQDQAWRAPSRVA